MDLFRIPDSVTLECEGEKSDAAVKFVKESSFLKVSVTANAEKPTFLKLRWNEKTDSDIKICGDAWERSYADLAWRSLESRRQMPWYFAAAGKDSVFCFGVKTGANSFVSFSMDREGVNCLIDIRSGTHGVSLGGRTLQAAILVFRNYEGISTFEALKRFCTELCDKPLSPKEPVYGGNNWYYAYGKSSRKEILSDAALQAELSKGNKNRPYMVIDDGWQENSCIGPWEPNKEFGDMKTLAEDFIKTGVKPGIWVRFLLNKADLPDFWHFSGDKAAPLDPSVPEVLEFIKSDIKKIRSWGYTLIKHDFSTYDIFGDWGKDLTGTITKKPDLTFFDGTRTSAEIVLDFYRAIREASGDAVIIGCNTVSHLSAGLCELNRIGDDTSGKEWKRTLEFGVNTLAFRLAQHKSFYDVDADCVGIMDNNISWEKNRQWLSLLAQSGTPLFVSCPDGVLDDSQKEDLKAAYRLAAAQNTSVEPIDWMNDNLPSLWKTSDGTVEYNWY